MIEMRRPHLRATRRPVADTGLKRVRVAAGGGVVRDPRDRARRIVEIQGHHHIVPCHRRRGEHGRDGRGLERVPVRRKARRDKRNRHEPPPEACYATHEFRQP